MERDLRDVMAENLAAREQSIGGLEPSPGALARSVRAVRRRRAVRHTSQAVGGFAVVAVLATGSWFGLRGDDVPEPAVTPTPAVSTPAPSPSPTNDAVAGLPPTQALPPGLLEQTTPGWVLAIYSSVPESAADLSAPLAHTVVLASPEGDLYRVVDLPADLNVSLLRWDAGSTTAVVRVDGERGASEAIAERAVLDLVSGAVTPTELGLEGGGWYGHYYLGQAADGAELWTEATSTDAYTSDVFRVTDGDPPELVGGIGFQWMLDPTRRWLVSNVPETFGDEPEPFVLLDVVNGGSTSISFGVPGQDCAAVGWLDPGQLLAFCLDVGYSEAGIRDVVAANAGYYRIDVDATPASATLLVRLGPSEPWPWRWDGAWAAPGSVAFTAETTALGDVTGCGAAYLWNGSAVVPIDAPPGTQVFPLAAGRVLLDGSTAGCSGGAAPTSVAAYDIETRDSTVLLPPPSPTPDVPVWGSGLGSWVVGD